MPDQAGIIRDQTLETCTLKAHMSEKTANIYFVIAKKE